MNRFNILRGVTPPITIQEVEPAPAVGEMSITKPEPCPTGGGGTFIRQFLRD